MQDYSCIRWGWLGVSERSQLQLEATTFVGAKGSRGMERFMASVRVVNVELEGPSA